MWHGQGRVTPSPRWWCGPKRAATLLARVDTDALQSPKNTTMTLNELIGKYARLRDEIDTLGYGEPSEAKRVRLLSELDQVDADLAEYRRLSRTAPMLLDVVPGYDDSALGPQDPEQYRSAA